MTTDKVNSILKIALPAILIWITAMTYGQVTVGGGVAPQNFSLLEIVTNHGSDGGNRSGGLRLPLLTTTERDALRASAAFQAEMTGKAKGLTIFNMTTNCVEVWNGSTWISTCAPYISSLNCGFLSGIPVIQGVASTGYGILPYSGKVGSDITLADNTPLGASDGLEVQVDGAQTLSAANGNISIKITGAANTSGTIIIPITLAGASCDATFISNPPYITAINCATVTQYIADNETITEGVSVDIATTLPYSGKVGSIVLNNDSLLSSVNGLEVRVNGDQTLTDADGNINIKITGTPETSGTIIIPITVGGYSCNISATSNPMIVFSPNFNVDSGTTRLSTTSVFADGTGDDLSRGTGESYNNILAGVFRYTGANGEAFVEQSTTHASGLTVTIPAGALANGVPGELEIRVSGTIDPSYAGKAFDIPVTILDQQLYVRVHVGCGAYTSTTRTIPSLTGDPAWLQFQCFNLGANTSSTSDPFSYVVGNADGSGGTLGYLYQWGRKPNGYELRTSLKTTTNITYNVNEPPTQLFLMNSNSPFDWRDPQIDTLWGDNKTTLDPCPEGWKVPSQIQLASLFKENVIEDFDPDTATNTTNTWTWTDNGYMVGSALYLPAAGNRDRGGTFNGIGSFGYYWTSTPISTINKDYSWSFMFSPLWGVNAKIKTARAAGFSIRCVAY